MSEDDQLRYHEGENHYGNRDYSPLLRPDGTELALLTEPEDREWYRDLSPVVDELNRLLDRIAELERERNEQINASIMRVVHGPGGINEQSENRRLRTALAAAEAGERHQREMNMVLNEALKAAERERDQFRDDRDAFRRSCLNREAQLAQARAAAETLWQILDDIDTLDDVCKENFVAFNRGAMRLVVRRHEYAKSDGYTLTWPWDETRAALEKTNDR